MKSQKLPTSSHLAAIRSLDLESFESLPPSASKDVEALLKAADSAVVNLVATAQRNLADDKSEEIIHIIIHLNESLLNYLAIRALLLTNVTESGR